jgi:hypothetical protein
LQDELGECSSIVSGAAGNSRDGLSNFTRCDLAVNHAAKRTKLFFKISSRSAPAVDSWRIALPENRLTVKMGWRKVDAQQAFS